MNRRDGLMGTDMNICRTHIHEQMGWSNGYRYEYVGHIYTNQLDDRMSTDMNICQTHIHIYMNRLDGQMSADMNICRTHIIYIYNNRRQVNQSHDPDTEPTTSPCPMLIIPSIWLGNNKYQFTKWFDSNPMISRMRGQCSTDWSTEPGTQSCTVENSGNCGVTAGSPRADTIYLQSHVVSS